MTILFVRSRNGTLRCVEHANDSDECIWRYVNGHPVCIKGQDEEREGKGDKQPKSGLKTSKTRDVKYTQKKRNEMYKRLFGGSRNNPMASISITHVR